MGSTTIFYLYWVRSYAHSKVSLVPSILPYLPLSPLLASVSPTCLCLPCFSLSPLSVPIHPVCPDPPRKVCWSINAEVNRAKDLGSVGQIRLKTLSTPSDIHTKNIYLFLRAWTWCPKSPFLSQSTPWQMWCFILQNMKASSGILKPNLIFWNSNLLKMLTKSYASRNLGILWKWLVR